MMLGNNLFGKGGAPVHQEKDLQDPMGQKKMQVPPLPPGSSWTPEQWQALNWPGGDLLVAAGAGSGKTRVLVERLIRRVTDSRDSLDLDRVLVVTFTHAAAGEMRQRIAGALKGAIDREPRSALLRRQLLLLNRASICTLHSFCLEVLRNYFYLQDLDPASRILEETQGQLLRQEVLEKVLEEYYEKQPEGSGFYQLLEGYSTYRGDGALQGLVMRLWAFSRSHPWPETWLREMAGRFHLPAGGLEATPWVKIILGDCRRELEKALVQLQEARRVASLPGGPAPYLVALEREITQVSRALEAARPGTGPGAPPGAWKELGDRVGGVSFGRLKACPRGQYDPGLAEQARASRDGAKKDLKALQEAFFCRSLEEQEEDLRRLAPPVQALVQLVQDFQESYREAKQKKGLLDFSDLEHYALNILRGPGSTPGKLVPSPAALDYRRLFREVMVDEYQDINPVQEAILQLVSRGEGGRLFMVGDVKQSIYRFRLAEPGLFLEKYREYSRGLGRGSCLDLSRNFRSRREVLAGVNYLFRRLMDVEVGEMDYGQEARLAYGASYPPYPGPDPGPHPAAAPGGGSPAAPRGTGDIPVGVLIIDRGAGEGQGPGGEGHPGEPGDDPGEGPGGAGEGPPLPEEEWEKAALEGRLVAAKIRELLGLDGGVPLQVYDRGEGAYRRAGFRDMVILLRSGVNWAPALGEELKQAGIPVYLELEKGYFQAVEVEVMVSLLKVIDNPYQDIPLAAVLRSPLVGLGAEGLAAVRLAAPREPFYDALRAFTREGAGLPGDPREAPPGNLPGETPPGPCPGDREMRCRSREFLARLGEWQRAARQGALADLVWQVFTDTGYYDLVGGMEGGSQRQANLRALYDRARQYEATSFRGLSRFLRFIERLQERDLDLGEARVLGPREDVVRVMTVHKSKGLEFPVVFVAGLSKDFNRRDLYQDFLLHRELGFGPRLVDTGLRVSYPTLPFLALRKRMELEMLAEEMRVLYVALTRAEQRLFLIATVNDLGTGVKKWSRQLAPGEKALPGYSRAGARGFLDWLGPAFLGHRDGAPLWEAGGVEPPEIPRDPEGSSWEFTILSPREVIRRGEGAVAREGAVVAPGRPEVSAFEPVEREVPDQLAQEIGRRLSWVYPHRGPTRWLAKRTVSELKRRPGEAPPGGDSVPLAEEFSREKPPVPRPWGREKVTPGERGTAYHLVMRYLDLAAPLTRGNIQVQLESMVSRQLLSPEEGEAVDPRDIAAFFQAPLGCRLRAAGEVYREVPFSLALPAAEIYGGGPGPRGNPGEDGGPGNETGGGSSPGERGPRRGPSPGEEKVLLQGAIDCLFRDRGGLVLLDYKTDRTGGLDYRELAGRYQEQLSLYARAVEDIWQEEIQEKYLYFFHGRRAVKL